MALKSYTRNKNIQYILTSKIVFQNLIYRKIKSIVLKSHIKAANYEAKS